MLSPVVFVALVAGLLPAFVWLTFWLLEDRLHPEPKRYIFFCFVAGMLLVAPLTINGHLIGIVLPLERFMLQYLSGFELLLSWAVIEEVTKFLAAYTVALRARVFDEPLDAVVYMVTVALGFSAAENALFLMNPITQGNLLQTVVTGDLRFIGATLLHTLASATVGVALALTYYKSKETKIWAAILGVILAIALHTLFNFFILRAGSAATFWIFLTIWLGIIAVLLIVERIKRPAARYS